MPATIKKDRIKVLTNSFPSIVCSHSNPKKPKEETESCFVLVEDGVACFSPDKTIDTHLVL